MRPRRDVELVSALLREGLGASEIARSTGIPRSTVRDWRNGRIPQRSPEQGCLELHLASLNEPAYAYLLGMYLGDGCISDHPRGVSRLRITLDAAYPGIVAYQHEQERAAALAPALESYNRFRRHRALGGLTPLQRVNNLSGANS